MMKGFFFLDKESGAWYWIRESIGKKYQAGQRVISTPGFVHDFSAKLT
jgi:hypothetical protein